MKGRGKGREGEESEGRSKGREEEEEGGRRGKGK